MVINDKSFFALYKFSILFIILFEILSFCAFVYPTFSSFAFLIIVGMTTIIAFYRFDIAMLILLVELFIGSQGGYMVAFGLVPGLLISVRLGLFLAVIGVWAASLVIETFASKERKERAWEWWHVMRKHHLLMPYFALLVVVVLGVVRGVFLKNNFGDIFFDANGYAFLGLFPAVVTAFSSRGMIQRTSTVLLAAITTSVAKALGIFFIFSHRLFSLASPLYVWIRDTRVGEITIMGADFYRIFFQAHIFALWMSFTALLVALLSSSWRKSPGRNAIGLLFLVGVSMMLSLSRSFWFGGIVAGVVFVAFLLWMRVKSDIWKRLVTIVGSCLIGASLIIVSVYAFPFPSKSGSVSFASLLGQRIFSFQGEAAVNSRWALLPKLWQAGLRHPFFGSGLGTSVTYATSDPRLLALNPTGAYTTYAFEWGYHDLWLKFGLFGLVMYGWFIIALLRPLVAIVRNKKNVFQEKTSDNNWRDKENVVIAAGLCFGMFAILGTNIFSPYFNHPLGIGIFMLTGVAGIYLAGGRRDSTIL